MRGEINYLGLTTEFTHAEYSFERDTRHNGKPSTHVFFNGFTFKIPSNDVGKRFAEEILRLNQQLNDPEQPDPLESEFYKPFIIKIYDASGYTIREIELIDAHIKFSRESFSAFQNSKKETETSMVMQMQVLSAIQRINGKALNVFRWHISDYGIEEYKPPVNSTAVEEKDKKPFRIDLEAKSRDIKDGVFGFDKIQNNYKNICKSDNEKLRQEYRPIPNVLGKEYLPPWLSIRKGQTVELELDWEKKGRADEYANITFDTHTDFTITPTDLKGVKKIQITCNNTNQKPVQILIKADDKTVGALNIFYPEPKKIELEWCFIEITGNGKDKNDLKTKINKPKLETLLKKGLNPALIDITVSNNPANIVDVTEYTERQKQKGVLKKHSDNRIGNYIERNLVSRVFGTIGIKHNEDKTKLTLYVINRKCITTADITDSGAFSMVGGLSPTGTGISYMVLGDENKIDLRNVMHEVMHSLGLKHTFLKRGENLANFIHIFEKEKTKNYMDYKTTKLYTRKWQWKKLHQYSHLK